MKAFKALFLTANLLAILSLTLVPDLEAQRICPGNTKMVTIQQQWATTQYYNQMQVQQQTLQQQKVQIQQQMMQTTQTKTQINHTAMAVNKASAVPIQETATQIAPQMAQTIQHQTQVINKTDVAIQHTPGMVCNKITPQIFTAQQTINKTNVQTHTTATPIQCTYTQIHTAQQQIQKTATDIHTTQQTIHHAQMAIQKTDVKIQKTEVKITKTPVTTLHTKTEQILLVNQDCAQCHHNQPTITAKGPHGLPPMVAQQPPRGPLMVGKQPPPLPPMLAMQQPVPPWVGNQQLPPVFLPKQPWPAPPLLAMQPQQPLPPFLRPPIAKGEPPFVMVPPLPKTLPVVIAKGPLPLVDLGLPAYMPKGYSKTNFGVDPAPVPFIAKMNKTPATALPAAIPDVSPELYLSIPGKLPADMLLQPVLERGKSDEAATNGSDTPVVLSEDDLQQPPQRVLPRAVIQRAGLPAVAESLPTDEDLLPTGTDMAPTKRSTSDLVPAALAPTTPAPAGPATQAPPGTLEQPAQPSKRNINL
jgi:hypothetical protein